MFTSQNQSVKIGNRLKELRINKGYKQEYLAEILEISQKTYSNMENDKSTISIDTLKKIADEYKIDLVDLLHDEKTIVQHNHSNDNGTFQSGIIINQLSEELLNQIKERVADLKQILLDRDKRIELLEQRINKESL
jgi:transcriptional regulator with XRE-family HTH domain